MMPEAEPVADIPRILVRPSVPYFVTKGGETWAPIGHNDAATWPDIAPLFRRRDIAAVERHLVALRDSGITCIRLMLEYYHGENRYLERPVRLFVPNMVAVVLGRVSGKAMP